MELVTGARVVAIGECMVELSTAGAGVWQMGEGGDTFNTAVHLARWGIGTAYFTAIGADPFSDTIRARIIGEGISDALVLTDPERLPGLYAIQTDAAGERFFHYWRDRAAVRRLFALDGVEAALERAADARLLYVSGITLSLFDGAERARLADLAAVVRSRGGLVAFDPNYRERGWADRSVARRAVEAFAPLVTMALPTLEDEAELWNERAPQTVIERWLGWGASEVALKLGARGSLVADGAAVTPITASPVRAVDATGAGDAFNAGYLAARLKGAPVQAAARFGNQMGATAVSHRGAIMPRGATPPLALVGTWMDGAE